MAQICRIYGLPRTSAPAGGASVANKESRPTWPFVAGSMDCEMGIAFSDCIVQKEFLEIWRQGWRCTFWKMAKESKRNE